jgi:ribosome-associated toxin RatA of RatAB toxin-antitoxin module
MHEVHRNAIVPHSPEAMFDLVADVAAYPEFLPWCTSAQVISTDDAEAPKEIVARLGISQGALKGHFTTRNKMERPCRIALTLVEGPFSELEGLWQIDSLGEEGCKLDLTMRFAFANPLKDMLLGTVFERSSNKLFDAFVARARALHG